MSSVLIRYVAIMVFVIVALLVALVFSHMTVRSYDSYIIDDTAEISEKLSENSRVAIVFGSAVDDIAKEPRAVVRQRLDAAYQLYVDGYIDSIVLSGYEDTEGNDYNEPNVMDIYLQRRGVNPTDIIIDAHGDNSLLTCRNAKHALEIDEAILISQDTHLARALYLCRSMDIDAYGFAAKSVPSRRWFFIQTTREALGNVKAVYDIQVRYNIWHENIR